MSGWNLADIIEAVAQAHPEAPAQLQGERRLTWEEMDRRTAALAATLVDSGAERQAKVAQYLYNGPEYLESVIASFKASLVPVNTNYRYQDAELLYLWDNADVVAVVFHGTFAERIDGLRARLPKIYTWLWVDDGSGPCPAWAEPYEPIVACGRRAELPWRRDGDDLLLLYTGGTTGIPKGVMWRQDDLLAIYNRARLPAPYDLERGLEGIVEQKRTEGPGRVVLPASPLMHGTGLLTGLMTMVSGGSVVTLTSRRFEPVEMLDGIHRHRVEGTAIVGDAFARPLLEALDANPGRWDISSLLGITSSGVMWSEEVKRGLLRHNPAMILRDALGSSESIGMANSESTGDAAERTAKFKLGDFSAVLDDRGKPVEPGSGVVGRIAVRGHLPVGYHKDEEKTARTFPVYDGVRWAIAGDYATVEADGSIALLGRGSVCINTGGEKVFPEEVEEALKAHPEVRDAVCVGVPDPRFGESITALVEPA
ncbi:MAG TPA: AMP-binding protein, partial [Thermoanaerobaculia bacterium]|nr:AMP-binding protein [Thermoanaerobaculia bacterium]